jgi:hypothetical protein
VIEVCGELAIGERAKMVGSASTVKQEAGSVGGLLALLDLSRPLKRRRSSR